MYRASILQMIQMLKNLDVFLDQGASLAEAKSFDNAHLLNARLAPDMFNLIRQVQSASDTAKFAAARLAGKVAPKFEDDETNFAEIKARIGATIEYLGGFEEADFAGAADREVTLQFLPAPVLGANCFLQFAQPNFYFHVSMAYAILRRNGVELGKRAFVGHMDIIG